MRRITIDILSDKEIIIHKQEDDIKELPDNHYIGQIGKKIKHKVLKNIDDSIVEVKKLALEMVDNKKKEIEKLRKKEK